MASLWSGKKFMKYNRLVFWFKIKAYCIKFTSGVSQSTYQYHSMKKVEKVAVKIGQIMVWYHIRQVGHKINMKHKT